MDIRKKGDNKFNLSIYEGLKVLTLRKLMPDDVEIRSFASMAAATAIEDIRNSNRLNIIVNDKDIITKVLGYF